MRTAATRRKRIGRIASVLARHGLDALTAGIGVDFLVPFHWGILGHARRPGPYSVAEHTRLAWRKQVLLPSRWARSEHTPRPASSPPDKRIGSGGTACLRYRRTRYVGVVASELPPTEQ